MDSGTKFQLRVCVSFTYMMILRKVLVSQQDYWKMLEGKIHFLSAYVSEQAQVHTYLMLGGAWSEVGWWLSSFSWRMVEQVEGKGTASRKPYPLKGEDCPERLNLV